MPALAQEELIRLAVDKAHVEGMLEIPQQAHGLIVFALGSGSSRHSPRNNYVATELHKAQFGTLLVDLLTPQEDSAYQMRSDIELLTRRLLAALDWVKRSNSTRTLPLGLFGASTGAAAALQAGAAYGARISAIVSRGGRADLAGRQALAKVLAPTLLIVGGADDVVITLNKMAYSALHCERRLEIIPGAGHLFEEAGMLQQVASLASHWFERHLTSPGIAG